MKSTEPFLVVDSKKFEFTRFVDSNNLFIEKIKVHEALKIARESGYDLVCVADSEGSDLPLCKLMDYGKWKYKTDKIKKKSPKKTEIKEIRFSPVISSHDIGHKVKHIQEFIENGHEIDLVMKIKGRQNLFVANEKMTEILDKCLTFSSLVFRKEDNGLISARLTKQKKEK